MTDAIRELLTEVSPEVLKAIDTLAAEKKEDYVFFRDLIKPIVLNLCK